MAEISSILIGVVLTILISFSAVQILKMMGVLLPASKPGKISGVQLSWGVYLLFTHVTFFWGILPIFEKAEWTLLKLSTVLVGPSLLLLSSKMISTLQSDNTADSRDLFIVLSKTFLPIYALFRLWQLVSHYFLPHYETISISALLTLFIIAGLRFVSSYRWHISGTIALWIIFIYTLVIKFIKGL